MSAPPAHADPEALRRIAGWLAEAGLDAIEIDGPGGGVRLRVLPEAPVEAAAAPPPVASTVLRADRTGLLLWRHPLHEEPFIGAGDTLIAGQVVALLRTGAVYAPVLAPGSGTVVRLLGEEGSLLGYGSPVLEFSPDR